MGSGMGMMGEGQMDQMMPMMEMMHSLHQDDASNVRDDGGARHPSATASATRKEVIDRARPGHDDKLPSYISKAGVASLDFLNTPDNQPASASGFDPRRVFLYLD